MKKYLIALALIFPLAVSAQTSGETVDLQNMIKQLQAQIQSLQTQVVDLKTEVQSLKIELKFNRVLAQGATGDDVKQLQEFLKTFTGAYPNGSVTGYFGPLTQSAVKKFQAQNDIESVGIVGPKTQEKLNLLATAIPAVSTTPVVLPAGIYAGETAPAQPVGQTGTQTVPAITMPPSPVMPATTCKTPVGAQIQSDVVTVLSPNGGENWQVGGTYTIKYSAKDTIGNKALLIYLEKGYDMPTTKTGANSSLLIGVTTNLESYTYNVPQNIQSFPGLGSNYKITVMVEGSYSSCGRVSYTGDSSDAEFSIVAGQGSVPGTSGGGYGVSAVPMPAPAPIFNPTIMITQEKIANIKAQITALQEKLNTTTDTATRDPLKAQIAALQTVIQELQNQIFQGQLLSGPTPTVSATTITPASGGGYGVSTTPMPAPAPSPTMQITQDKIANVQAQITALQEKLNTTTDITTRDSLMAQIAALKTQMEALVKERQSQTTQNPLSILYAQDSALIKQFNSTTDTAARSALWAQMTAVSEQIQALTPPEPTTQKQMNSLLETINAYQNKLNNTTDVAALDSLTAQIIALKARIQTLESNPTTPAVQLLFTQITALQNQLSGTTDATIRNSLVSQIVALKAQMASERRPTTPVVQPAVPMLSGATSAPIPAQGNFVPAQISPANQDKINNLYEQINVLGNQLNSTIDTAKRDSLVAQIILLKAQVSALQTSPTVVPATSGATTIGGGSGYVQPAQNNPTATQSPSESAAYKLTSQADQDKLTIIYKQISTLLDKLNGVTDTAIQNSLWAQIGELKAQAQVIYSGNQ